MREKIFIALTLLLQIIVVTSFSATTSGSHVTDVTSKSPPSTVTYGPGRIQLWPEDPIDSWILSTFFTIIYEIVAVVGLTIYFSMKLYNSMVHAYDIFTRKSIEDGKDEETRRQPRRKKEGPDFTPDQVFYKEKYLTFLSQKYPNISRPVTQPDFYYQIPKFLPTSISSTNYVN